MSKCNTCAREKCFHRSSTVVGCSQFVPKQKTNADYIRSMSDEELASFIASLDCPYRWRECNGHCDECVLGWLKQPADDLPKITDQTKNALEKMGEKAHGGE